MKINPEVATALKEGRPVVALESTIISHGMPYPRNVETAMLVEKTVRDNGAIPATMGIINGEPIVGMSPEEIEEFGKKKGIAKVSKRDFPIVVATKKWGATTVSATILMAKMAGIEVFVTGGIGGVHRGAEHTFDISRDLFELGAEPVTVVCAGAKAILDIDKTLEVLESQGVTVLSYKEKDFANFYCRDSGKGVDHVFMSPKEAASIILAKREYNLSGGILISNPVPEEDALSHEFIDKIIDEAVKEADEQGIKGKDITPFLLKRIVELTGGKSLESNIHLVVNNAALGAQIAKEYAQLRKER
ncbi:MAG: pseudouridine-5'-phosphate glycosidase [Bacilli bacterium]|jgi:pseudouridine-5'-phosphate glycosidase|nr:pseudouridine-5'-phosphate glycosidase [Bacilli bacterium]MCH4277572.1 pseudouridine-5'-phosphate glycosidase [Bacilli bacterium]MCI2055124.1 pseudouridine-5'-phosphate glycosidase [Bacilli bacterium]